MLDLSLVIKAQPRRIVKAFFEHDALVSWWQVAHAVTSPRVLGPYAVEWTPTDFRDEILGRLGGVFRGTVMRFDPTGGFSIADAYWLPPDSDPIGPMALEVTCEVVDTSRTTDQPGDMATRVRVRQTGFEESPRWRRYYDVATVGWERALASLKTLLEQQP